VILEGYIQLLLFSLLGGLITMLQLLYLVHYTPNEHQTSRWWFDLILMFIVGVLIGCRDIGYIP